MTFHQACGSACASSVSGPTGCTRVLEQPSGRGAPRRRLVGCRARPRRPGRRARPVEFMTTLLRISESSTPRRRSLARFGCAGPPAPCAAPIADDRQPRASRSGERRGRGGAGRSMWPRAARPPAVGLHARRACPLHEQSEPGTAGRPAAELTELVAALDRVRSTGTAMCVEIFGEPGIGKSRLLRELSGAGAAARDAGAVGRCDGVRAARAVRGCSRTPGGGGRGPGHRSAGAPGPRAARPAAQHLPVRCPPPDGAPRPSSTPSATCCTGRCTASSRCWRAPMAWCSSSTTSTGRTRAPPSCSTTCCATHRRGRCCWWPRTGRASCRRGCARAWPRRRPRADDVAASWGRCRRRGVELLPTGQDAGALYAASGGNPFYLEALARGGGVRGRRRGRGRRGRRGAELRGRADRRAGGADRGPAGRRAGGGARRATSATRRRWWRSPACPLGVVLDALDVLAARDLVRAAEVPGRFRFRHPLVRHVTYSSAGPGWLVGAHARAAAALASRGVARRRPGAPHGALCAARRHGRRAGAHRRG